MSTQLNDLAHRLAQLASVSGCTVTVRLIGGEHGNTLELRATQASATEAREYTRQLTLRTLACSGAAQLAAEFLREARLAFATALPAAARRSRL